MTTAATTTPETRDGIRRRGTTWTALWWVNDTATGEPRQRSKGGFRTRRDAVAHRTTQLAAINDGSYTEVTDKTITIGRFLTDVWLPAIRTGDRRPSTIASYECAVDKWITPHIGGIRLVALTPRHVETLLATLRESGGRHGQPLSDRSVQYAYSTLRMAVDRAQRHGYVPRNVVATVDRPGAGQPSVDWWTTEQAQRFLRATATDRLFAAWALLLARGPRRGEIAGLRWSDVDLDRGTATIRHTRVSIGGRVVDSTPKTKAGGRTLSLDPGLVAVLRRHRTAQLADRMAAGPAWTNDADLVFTREDGQPYHPEHFSDRFDRLCAAADVPRIRLHDTRHTAASLMLAAKTPVKIVQEMLGHASPTITQTIYAHTIEGMGEAAGTQHSAALGIIADE
ncbi:tyrosine-type recombinase/integrase [Actinomycetospora sp. CA-101289]|uniref:tyrosine-type recombinase/integrase n=1 Tax=Actinomycetospora sp. CA-101289 TaxID=3239893 RepID=UPI003D97A4F3